LVNIPNFTLRQPDPSGSKAENQERKMTQIAVKLTVKELELLSSLASDQLFRREFIDPRLPGYKTNPAELTCGKHLVERLKVILERTRRAPLPARSRAAA
jgi:hypothetical protein